MKSLTLKTFQKTLPRAPRSHSDYSCQSYVRDAGHHTPWTSSQPFSREWSCLGTSTFVHRQKLKVKGRCGNSRNVYGLADASLYWYNRVKTTMLETGATMSQVDPAVFHWLDQDCSVTGILACHVDEEGSRSNLSPVPSGSLYLRADRGGPR